MDKGRKKAWSEEGAAQGVGRQGRNGGRGGTSREPNYRSARLGAWRSQNGHPTN